MTGVQTCALPISWKPTHGLQEKPMDKSFKYNSMQPLVHRECHHLPKPPRDSCTLNCQTCVLLSTLLLRNTQIMEEHNLYWPSKPFSHFGNRCQWGRSFRELCGEALVYVSLAFASHSHALLVGALHGDA